MSQVYTWTYDATDGVYKNHHISAKLLELAAEKFIFVPFTDKLPGYGKRMGETVNIFHYKETSEPTSAKLEERTRVPIDKLEMGTRAITIYEWGRGIEYTNLAQELSMFDPKQGAQKTLARQMGKVMDTAAATAFNEAKVIFIPTSLTGGTWDTDGTASTQATFNLTKAHLGTIRDYMTNDLHVPFYTGNHYIGAFATKGLRGLKDDRVIEAWNMYLRKGDLIYNSEIGQCESVRLLEVTHESALSNGVGTGSVLGEGVVFGDEAVTRIEVDFPHLRADPNFSGDFGRVKAVIWYGIVSFATTWNTATDLEAKIVRVSSS